MHFTSINNRKVLMLAAMLSLPSLLQAQSAQVEVLSPRQQATNTLTPSALQIHVQCGNPAARIQSISAGLRLLGTLHPAVLLISGTCHEEVLIEGLADITLQGNPAATIDGGTDLNNATVLILGSQNIAL